MGHSEVVHDENIVILDSGVDTCLCVWDFVALEETDHKMDVIGYNDDIRTKDITIGPAMTLVTSYDGIKVLIHVNKGMLDEQGKSLFSTTQIRHFKHHVDDTPQQFGGKRFIDILKGHQLLFHLDNGVLITIFCLQTDEK